MILVFVLFFFIPSQAISHGNPSINYDAGVKYAINGKFQEAEKEFKEVLDVFQDYTPAKVSLVVIEDVIAHKIKSEVAVHFFQGVAYANQNKLDDALSEFNRVIKIDPSYAFAYYNRGIFYHFKEDYRHALLDYTKAISLDDKMTEAYINRGRIYFKIEKDVNRACDDWETACSLGQCGHLRAAHKENYCKDKTIVP